MAPTGGAYGLGTIYKIHQEHNGTWNLTVIHAFTGGADGATGSAGRMVLRHGRLFGAVTAGGTYGSGVVFELRPTGGGEWNFRTIYSFRGQPDGSFPYGALLFDRVGNIYGTTYYGGANGIGSVYQLSPRAIGEWNESVLYSFQEGSDGNSPISNLVADGVGNLYGTTSEGGLGSGTIFKLSPIGGGQWMETVVPPSKARQTFAHNGMVVDLFGVYGATVHGGDNNDGPSASSRLIAQRASYKLHRPQSATRLRRLQLFRAAAGSVKGVALAEIAGLQPRRNQRARCSNCRG
jgi:uncharacterized repeat protein (TIGR03803 family)